MPIEVPLYDMTAVEIVSAYKNGPISPVDVLEAVLSRVAAWEPQLNALYAFDPDAPSSSASRGRRYHLLENDNAGLRDALLGTFKLHRNYAKPMGSE